MATVGQIILMSRDLHIDNSTQYYPATDLFAESKLFYIPSFSDSCSRFNDAHTDIHESLTSALMLNIDIDGYFGEGFRHL